MDSQNNSPNSKNQFYSHTATPKPVTTSINKRVLLSTKPSISENLDFQSSINKEIYSTKSEYAIKDRENLLIRCRETILDLETELAHERNQSRLFKKELQKQETIIQDLINQKQQYKLRCFKLAQSSSGTLDNLQQQASSEILALHEKIKNLEINIEELTERNNDLNEQLEKNNKQIQNLQSQNKSLQSNCQLLQQQQEEKQTILDQFESQIKEYKKTIRHLEEKFTFKERSLSLELTSLHTKSREDTLILQQDLIQKLNKAQQAISSYNGQIIQLQEENEYLNLQCLNLQEEKSNLLLSGKQKDIQIRNLVEQVEECIKEKDLAIIQEKNSFKEKCVEYEAQNQQMNQQFNEISQQVSQLEKEKLSCTDYIEKMEKVAQQDEQYIIKLTKEIEYAKQKDAQQQELQEQQMNENIQLSQTVIELNQQLESLKEQHQDLQVKVQVKLQKLQNELKEVQQLKKNYEEEIQEYQRKLDSQDQESQIIKNQYETDLDQMKKQIKQEKEEKANLEIILTKLQNQIFELEKRVDVESSQYLLNTSKINEENLVQKSKYEKKIKQLQQNMIDKINRFVATLQDEIQYLKTWNDNIMLEEQSNKYGYQFSEHLRHVINRLDDRLQWINNNTQPIILLITRKQLNLKLSKDKLIMYLDQKHLISIYSQIKSSTKTNKIRIQNSQNSIFQHRVLYLLVQNHQASISFYTQCLKKEFFDINSSESHFAVNLIRHQYNWKIVKQM